VYYRRFNPKDGVLVKDVHPPQCFAQLWWRIDDESRAIVGYFERDDATKRVVPECYRFEIALNPVGDP
jgi:hypothetical protein